MLMLNACKRIQDTEENGWISSWDSEMRSVRVGGTLFHGHVYQEQPSSGALKLRSSRRNETC
jgi:hypothetical protein